MYMEGSKFGEADKPMQTRLLFFEIVDFTRGVFVPVFRGIRLGEFSGVVTFSESSRARTRPAGQHGKAELHNTVCFFCPLLGRGRLVLSLVLDTQGSEEKWTSMWNFEKGSPHTVTFQVTRR
ncbi:unnamed protein product [Ectocarpus sp. 4 AP-2014]